MTVGHQPPPEFPAPISNNEIYKGSTQYKIWTFTKSQLESIRERVNKNGIKNTLDKINSLDQSLPEVQILKSSPFVYITQDEELQLINCFAKIIHDIALLIKMPKDANAAAISFLHRFYLFHSVMDYHPQLIMYSCLILAGKAHNMLLPAEQFATQFLGAPVESALRYEYLILKTMKFTVMVYSPYKPLTIYYREIPDLLPSINATNLSNVYQHAREWVDESMYTDLTFLYPPSQIALACLWLGKSDKHNVYDRIGEEIVRRFLTEKFRSHSIEGNPQERFQNIEDQWGSLEGMEETDQFEVLDDVTKDTKIQDYYNRLIRVINECVAIIEGRKVLDLGNENSRKLAKAISAKACACIDPQMYGEELLEKKSRKSEKLKHNKDNGACPRLDR